MKLQSVPTAKYSATPIIRTRWTEQNRVRVGFGFRFRLRIGFGSGSESEPDSNSGSDNRGCTVYSLNLIRWQRFMVLQIISANLYTLYS